MITKIEVTNNTNTPIQYLSELGAFKDGTVYEFKPGVNIIIGPNGCGKSTLLDLISRFTFCRGTMVSQFPEYLFPLELNDLFWEDGKLKDGVKIHHDYLGSVFRYAELKRDCAMSTKNDSIMKGLDILFGKIFSGEVHLFPLGDIRKKINTANEMWSPRLENLLEYYKDNRIEVLSDYEFEYTILLDEPDKNLDIYNIKRLSKYLLSTLRPQTQIIAAIHNPSVIYKLWKQKGVNIIEMTPEYLQKVIDYIDYNEWKF